MIISDVPQGSTAWFEIRLARPSASRASEIYTMTGVVSKSREAYLEELAWEKILGTKEDGYKSSAMAAGNAAEEQASNEFSADFGGVELTTVGCVFYDEDKRFLASPDRLILDWKEGFETKLATQRKIQKARLLSKKPDPDHWCQVQMGMLCTGYKAWWYQSYHSEIKPMRIKIMRDEKYISELHRQIDIFLVDLEKTVARLREL